MLSNFDIIDICDSLGIPLIEVCCKDELPNKKIYGAFVVNMANHNETGTHWVSFIHTKNHTLYFDSFGIGPPLEVSNYVGKKTKLIYNNNELQNINSECCGWWCIAFLYYILNGGTGYGFVNMFKKDPTKNTKILLKYVAKIMKN